MRKGILVSLLLGLIVATCGTRQGARIAWAPTPSLPASDSSTAPVPDGEAPPPASPDQTPPASPDQTPPAITEQPIVSAPPEPAAPPAAGLPEDPHDPPAPLQHVDVRGLYMTGHVAGSPLFYELVDYVVSSGLNAVVIDVKDDTGTLSWPMDIPLANEIGAGVRKIPDIAERIRHLESKGIYPIARIVCYADPLLGSKRPDLAIQGGRFIDSRGIRWPDPYNQEVWKYNIAVAQEAARVGFREVQFDYIRFPEIRIEGYNYLVPVEQRTAAIEGFLRLATAELHKLGVFISADVFGLTTSVALDDDMEIGQDYAQIAAIVDYIKPMVYPSHYAPHTYGVADPNSDPGKIVYESLVRAQKRTWELPVRKHRPWVQDFDVGKDYTGADVEAQIRSLAEAGIYQWILWDPSNRYSRDANYRIAPPTGQEPDWRVAYREELAEQARAEAAARAEAEAPARAKMEIESRPDTEAGIRPRVGEGAGPGVGSSATGSG